MTEVKTPKADDTAEERAEALNSQKEKADADAKKAADEAKEKNKPVFDADQAVVAETTDGKFVAVSKAFQGGQGYVVVDSEGTVYEANPETLLIENAEEKQKAAEAAAKTEAKTDTPTATTTSRKS